MARVTGPLLSIDASGKLADTLVFSHWRGIKYARMWLVPTNPDTALQQARRALIADAVAHWKVELAETQQAMRDYQGGQPFSGFNYLVQQYIADKDNGHTPTSSTVAVDLDVGTTTEITVSYETGSAFNGRAFLGTSHRSYFKTDDEGAPVTVHEHVFTGLTPGVKYFVMLRMSTANPSFTGGEYTAVCT